MECMMKSRRRKIKTYESHGISIRELSPTYFQVDYMRNGKRERKGYETLAEAETHCALIATKLVNEGTSVLNLTPTQREDAVQALAKLGDKTTLTAAAAFWMAHNAPEGGLTVEELGKRWLANLKVQKCRPMTIRERGYKVSKLTASLGKLPVAGITRDRLETWLGNLGVTGATWDTYRRFLRAMFQYAVKQKFLDYNPAAAFDPVRQDEVLPQAMSVGAVESIMRTVQQYAPIMVPTLAVQFFGGCRPGEALGMDWSAIDFKQKIIRVLPETSKVRRTRIVDMNQTLIEWLLPYRRPSGRIGICSKNQFSYFMLRKPIGPEYEQEGVPIGKRETDGRPRGIAKAANVQWIQDGPRKTFATMHFATFGNVAKLETILGHTGGSDVLYRHYRALATKADARRYWKIRPKQEGKVIQFAAAAG